MVKFGESGLKKKAQAARTEGKRGVEAKPVWYKT